MLIITRRARTRTKPPSLLIVPFHPLAPSNVDWGVAGPGGRAAHVRGCHGRADGVGHGEGGRVDVRLGGSGRAGMLAVFKGIRAALAV